MRTFLRISLLGNAFLDLACILLLLPHGSGNQPPGAALSPKPAVEQAAADNNNPIVVFAVEVPFASRERSSSYSAGLPDGSTMPAELMRLGGIPKYTLAYEVDWLNWRFEGWPLDARLGEGAYARPSR